MKVDVVGAVGISDVDTDMLMFPSLEFLDLDCVDVAHVVDVGVVVVVATEFGRTVATNGSGGTDHGTGGAALLYGGAVRGGRVLADWPGLAARQLYEGRDLRPTLDTRQLLKGVIAAQFDLRSAELDRLVFPDSQGVPGLNGLVT